MTAEQIALAAALDRLSTDAARLADRFRRLSKAGDAMDNLGGRLCVAQAATVCEVSDQAIYIWIDLATRMGSPFAEKHANVWIIKTAQLLAYIGKYRGGLPARVKAENRLKEFWPIWSR